MTEKHSKDHAHKADEHKADEHEVEHKKSSEHKAEHKPAHEKVDHKHKTEHKHETKSHAHKSKPKKQKTNYTPYIAIAAIIGLIVIIVLATGNKSEPTSVDNPSQYGSVDVDFYVMSQCPYGTQVEDGFAPVLAELGDNIDFELNFIASPNGDGFNSLHGQPEVEGDLLHLCAQDLYPESFMDFIVCQNKKYNDLVGTIDSCAEKAGIDASKLKDCAASEKAKEMLRESGAKAQAAQAQGSPTMYFNGVLYQGGRDETSFKRTVCAALDDHPICAEIPDCSSDVDCTPKDGSIGVCKNPGKKDAECVYQKDAEVKLTVVNANACIDCNPSQLITTLEQVFLNMDVNIIEATTSKGKELIKKHNLEKAPAFIFEGVDETYAWENNPRIPTAFKDSGDMKILLDEASGSKYILDETKRAEMEAKVGVVKGDNKPQIDFYVMSYCPYGNIAEEAIEPAFRLLGDKADFNPHYVIYSNYQGGGPAYCIDDESKYCSMHGVQEMTQGVRELCVDKYLGSEAYFDFVLEMNKKCTYQNADSCWEAVAKDLKLNTDKIKDCETNEWEELLSNELELNQILGVQGSPTVFVEGAAYSGAREPRAYADSICAGFENKPAECAKTGTLVGSSSAAAVPAGACG